MDAEIVLTLTDGSKRVSKTLRMGGDFPLDPFLDVLHDYVQAHLGTIIVQLGSDLAKTPTASGASAKRAKTKTEEKDAQHGKNGPVQGSVPGNEAP